VQYLPLSVAWDASKADKWGSTAFNLNASRNFSALFDSKSDFRRAAGSGKASGNFLILNPGLTREQKVYGDWSIRLHADGQWANQPLISTEQFGLGGLAGVRGYREGQEYGDTGWRVLLEPHTPLWKVALGENNTLQTLVRLSLFTDYGQRYLLAPSAGRSGSLAMWGAGFAISATRGEHFDVRLTFGVPLLDVPGVNAWTPRLTFGVSMQF